ncbi:MAG: hypothetical protein WC551_07220 [Patescibacteria group bacterium]
MQNPTRLLLPLFVFLVSSFILVRPASAAMTVSAITPANATVGVPVTFTASVVSPAGINYCKLNVDLDDVGEMTVSGNTASRSFTFNAGGSRVAFVYCKDNSGGIVSGPNTAIWVEGTIVNSSPMSPSQPPAQQPAAQQQSTSTASQESPDAHKLMKLACPTGASSDDPCKAVYYVSADGKRHAYPNSKVFFTWYGNFDSVETVTPEKLASFPLGKNVTYRPGQRMVKFQTGDKVYAVGQEGLLRWVPTESIAKTLYGNDWNTKIDDIADAFFVDYRYGADISPSIDYSPTLEASKATTF